MQLIQGVGTVLATKLARDDQKHKQLDLRPDTRTIRALKQGESMKKTMITALAAATIVTAGFGVTALRGTASADYPSDIVGTWEVTAVAPYAPHLFTFNRDGTMLSTNPTNVQESATKPDGGTNDSVGMGEWRVVTLQSGRYIEGTFEELNALADTHQPTDKLSVSFKVALSDNDMTFDGPASATVGSETDPSHLTGTRLAIDQAAINKL